MNKKYTFIIIGAIVILGLASFTAEKIFTLKFSEAAINKHYQNLGAIKQIVEKSNLPHQEVVFIANSIDSLQRDIVNQVRTQVEQPAPSKK
ncbi:MAG: hypothetical protein ACKOW2_04080 [Sphingobacteriaceae bacterium]